MIGVVDAGTRTVRVGEHRWPFVLDLRSHTVSVTIGGAAYRLRPLRWGEKRGLARFAHLGEQFLAEEFVRLCLAEEPAARGAGEMDVLFPLAAWMNNPDRQDSALPLDARLLLRITVEVCGRFGHAMEALDGMSVPDVELFWSACEPRAPGVDVSAPAAPTPAAPEGGRRASAASSAPGAGPAPGMNRILIVPDDFAGAGRDATASDAPLPSASALASASAGPLVAPAALPHALSDDRAAPLVAHRRPAASTGRSRDLFSGDSRDPSRRGLPRFRVRLGNAGMGRDDGAPRAMAAAVAVDGDGDGDGANAGDESPAGAPRPREPRQTRPTSDPPAAGIAAEGPAILSLPAASHRVSQDPFEMLRPNLPAPPAEGAAVEADRAMDGWVEQIEEAAEELGILLEG